jgi:cell shape-determining protein MreC
MDNFKKNFYILSIIMLLIYFLNFIPVMAEVYNNSRLTIFRWNNFFSDILKNINLFSFLKDESNYKEKYFNLLREIYQIKLYQQEKLFSESFNLIKNKYPNASNVKVIDRQLGIIYTENYPTITNKAIAIDNKWVLIGKVNKPPQGKYLKIVSLLSPNLRFGVSDIDGNFIGIAQSTGLGYLIINNLDKKINIKEGDLILTSGNDDFFPRGFLVGEVSEVEELGFVKNIKIEPIGDFFADYLIILP